MVSADRPSKRPNALLPLTKAKVFWCLSHRQLCSQEVQVEEHQTANATFPAFTRRLDMRFTAESRFFQTFHIKARDWSNDTIWQHGWTDQE